jgi:hypothetical protein
MSDVDKFLFRFSAKDRELYANIISDHSMRERYLDELNRELKLSFWSTLVIAFVFTILLIFTEELSLVILLLGITLCLSIVRRYHIIAELKSFIKTGSQKDTGTEKGRTEKDDMGGVEKGVERRK